MFGCDIDFTSGVPMVKELAFTFEMYDNIKPVQLGADISVFKQLIDHPDISGWLEELEATGKSTMISNHHSIREITCILDWVKNYLLFAHWWENLFSNTFINNKVWHILIHPFVVIIQFVTILYGG